jgi:branched-chain amino acid transport system substrate-binding protein
MRRAIAALALPLFLAIALSAAEPIRIGEIEALTGREAGLGQTSRRGFALAAEVINARGGVLGRPIEFVVEDTHSKAGDAATAARKLVARDKVIAVVCGGTSTNTLEAAPICQQAQIPLFASVSTNPQVTAMGSYVFRACFVDSFQGGVLAKLARDRLKLSRVALLVAKSSAYSDGLAREFRQQFTAAGGEALGPWFYNEGEKDFRAALTAIRAAKPDAILVPAYYAEAALVCQQARNLGLNIPLLGGDGWEAPELLSIGGKAVEGVYYVSHFAPDRRAPEVQAFVEKYRARHGDVPNGGAALAYDTVLMLAAAIQRAGATEGSRVREALAATRDFDGITGLTTFDRDRNVAKSAVILTIRNGRPEFFQSIAP